MKTGIKSTKIRTNTNLFFIESLLKIIKHFSMPISRVKYFIITILYLLYFTYLTKPTSSGIIWLKETIMRKGYIHIYTGNGKGKTTASMGLAVRALGAGLNVYFTQFTKKGKYSEIKALESIASSLFDGRLTVEQFGVQRKVMSPFNKEDKIVAEEGLKKIKEAFSSGKYDLIIMDEFNIAVHYKLLDMKAAVELIKSKPDSVELVLTGRYADNSIIETADLVTEMCEKKHYADKGVPARKGIEM